MNHQRNLDHLRIFREEKERHHGRVRLFRSRVSAHPYRTYRNRPEKFHEIPLSSPYCKRLKTSVSKSTVKYIFSSSYPFNYHFISAGTAINTRHASSDVPDRQSSNWHSSVYRDKTSALPITTLSAPHVINQLEIRPRSYRTMNFP